MTFAVRRNRVFVRAAIASSNLDLDAMGLTRAGNAKRKRSAKRSGRDKSLVRDLESLRGVDASIKLNAKRVRTNGIGLKGVSLNLAISDGVVVLRPFKAGIGGGVATADITLDATSEAPALALILRTKKVDAAELTPSRRAI